jgi:uncharacterized protein YbcV (DUF1398 family)
MKVKIIYLETFKKMLKVMDKEGILKWRNGMRQRKGNEYYVLDENKKLLTFEEAIEKYGGTQ